MKVSQRRLDLPLGFFSTDEDVEEDAASAGRKGSFCRKEACGEVPSEGTGAAAAAGGLSMLVTSTDPWSQLFDSSLFGGKDPKCRNYAFNGFGDADLPGLGDQTRKRPPV